MRLSDLERSKGGPGVVTLKGVLRKQGRGNLGDVGVEWDHWPNTSVNLAGVGEIKKGFWGEKGGMF